MKMKIFICFLFFLLFTQLAFASEYPPSEETIKKELGLKYYELRKQLPYDDAGNFFIDEALIKKEQVLNILLKLLNDKTIITTQKGSLFENLSINSSMDMFYENQFIISAITNLLIISNGYMSYSQASSDHFGKFSEKDKQTINSMEDIQNKYYSMLYQKTDNMSPPCADVLARYNLSAQNISSDLNNEALKAFKEAIEKGCINIGIIAHYADALIEKGKYSNSLSEARKQVVDLYKNFFDRLSDLDLNQLSAIELLQKVSQIKENEGDLEFVLGINKKVVKLISSGRLKLTDKPQWFRVHYIWLLSRTLNAKEKSQIKEKDEIISELKSLTRKRGNIFILKDEEMPKELSNQEREFLKLLQK